MSDSLWPYGPIRLFGPWDSPDKNTGVGCYALLQRIFPGEENSKKVTSFFFYTLIIYFIKWYNQHYKSVLEHFHLFNKIFTWHQWSGPTGQGSTCWVEAFVSIQIHSHRGFPAGASGKEPACQCRRRRFNPFPAGKILWRRAWQPTPVFLAWRIPWTEEPGGLQSIGLHRVGTQLKWLSKESQAIFPGPGASVQAGKLIISKTQISYYFFRYPHWKFSQGKRLPHKSNLCSLYLLLVWDSGKGSNRVSLCYWWAPPNTKYLRTEASSWHLGLPW